MPKKKNKETQTAKQESTPSGSKVIKEVTPEYLLALADQEENRRELREYSQIITLLRDEKNFTFREIANWLQDHGVYADHNAVYREYTRGMPDEVAHGEALSDEATEREEHRN